MEGVGANNFHVEGMADFGSNGSKAETFAYGMVIICGTLYYNISLSEQHSFNMMLISANYKIDINVTCYTMAST